MLELKHIHKYYNAGTVNEMCLFNDFNLTIEDHQFVSVVGSNGSGKTSLLNIICGSIPLDDGRIIIGGEDITKMPEYKRQRRIGRVYQNPSMGTCPSMTIAENMALADNKGKAFNLRPCLLYTSCLSQMGPPPFCLLCRKWGSHQRSGTWKRKHIHDCPYVCGLSLIHI